MRSERLFGSRHRLPLAAAIADASELFYAAEFAEALEVHPREVGRQLDALERAGLVERTDPPEDLKRAAPGRVPFFFRRRDEDFWECLGRLAEPYRLED